MVQTYAEKLRDPRWQKRRLEVLERDGWRCRICGDDTTELHVHHRWYEGQPWEAADAALMTLCAPCHKREGLCWKANADLLLPALQVAGFNSDELALLVIALQASVDRPYLRHAIALAVQKVLGHA